MWSETSYSQVTSSLTLSHFAFVLHFTVKESEEVYVVFLIWIQTWDLLRGIHLQLNPAYFRTWIRTARLFDFEIPLASSVPETPLEKFHANDVVIALAFWALRSRVRTSRALDSSCNCRRILIWFSQIREVTADRHLENPPFLFFAVYEVCSTTAMQILCLEGILKWEFRKCYLHL